MSSSAPERVELIYGHRLTCPIPKWPCTSEPVGPVGVVVIGGFSQPVVATVSDKRHSAAPLSARARGSALCLRAAVELPGQHGDCDPVADEHAHAGSAGVEHERRAWLDVDVEPVPRP